MARGYTTQNHYCVSHGYTSSAIFARYGIPEVVVTDNGLQFVSDMFKRFCEDNGIKHLQCKIGSIPP